MNYSLKILYIKSMIVLILTSRIYIRRLYLTYQQCLANYLFKQVSLQLFPKHINPQCNPHFGLFLSLNTYYSYLNCVLHLVMTDVAKSRTSVNNSKSFREDVDMLKKRRVKRAEARNLTCAPATSTGATTVE